MPGLERVHQPPEPVSSQPERNDRLAKAYITFQVKMIEHLEIPKKEVADYLEHAAPRFEKFWKKRIDFQERALQALDDDDTKELVTLFSEAEHELGGDEFWKAQPKVTIH